LVRATVLAKLADFRRVGARVPPRSSHMIMVCCGCRIRLEGRSMSSTLVPSKGLRTPPFGHEACTPSGRSQLASRSSPVASSPSSLSPFALVSLSPWLGNPTATRPERRSPNCPHDLAGWRPRRRPSGSPIQPHDHPTRRTQNVIGRSRRSAATRRRDCRANPRCPGTDEARHLEQTGGGRTGDL
jgi:hypothetical protein